MKQTIKNGIVIFEDGEFRLPVELSSEEETAWLRQHQIAVFFNEKKV